MPIDSTSKISRTSLTDLCLLKVSGPDRFDFLQGQLTQDMAVLEQQLTALAGWATAKGRLLLIGQLFAWRQSVLIVVPSVTAEQLLNRLRMFTLRAEVEIGISDLSIVGLIGHGLDSPLEIDGLNLGASALACAASEQIILSRTAGDPSRLLMIGDQSSVATALSQCSIVPSQGCWNLANIKAGIPVILQETLESFVPQMTNLDLLNGISFTKGCYVGQEIVARTANLGRIKRRMFRYQCKPATKPAAGATIYNSDGPAGVIVTTAPFDDGFEILAVTQLRLVDSPLFIDEACKHPLNRQSLPYDLSGDEARR